MIAVAAILVIAILQATKSVDLAGFFTDQINRVKGGADAPAASRSLHRLARRRPARGRWSTSG